MRKHLSGDGDYKILMKIMAQKRKLTGWLGLNVGFGRRGLKVAAGENYTLKACVDMKARAKRKFYFKKF